MEKLLEQAKKGTFKRVIGYVADDIEGGATLSEAMSKHKKNSPLLKTMLYI